MTRWHVHPLIRGMYLIDTVLLTGNDPKPRRPVVVLAQPAYGLTSVPVLARTTDTSIDGVRHPRNNGLQLSKDGMFAYRYLRHVDVRHFTASPNAVVFLGMLEPEYYAWVQQWWEER